MEIFGRSAALTIKTTDSLEIAVGGSNDEQLTSEPKWSASVSILNSELKINEVIRIPVELSDGLIGVEGTTAVDHTYIDHIAYHLSSDGSDQ